jgi:four helix bundle protein
MPRDHRRLRVFETADDLALRVYHASRGLPQEERYALQSQMWRAAMSVPTNIVEGCARRSDAEYGRFINIALGSAAETQYLLSVARRLHLLPKATCEPLERSYEALRKALNRLLGAIEGFE